MSLSKKQKASYRESTARINLWEGAVRSGKTFISILRLIRELKDGPPGLAMIIGVNRESIQRNILTEVCSLIGAPMPTPKATQINLFGRTIFLVGANDERAQRRIQGSTLAIAYVDEVTLIPYGFFRMLLSRLSVPGAKLLCTTNPDSPFHWLKTDFIANEELDMKVFSFRLEDNPSLEKSYVDNLKREYTGLWYKRYINGEWVLAEGTVYDMFDELVHVIDSPPTLGKEYVVGIDYGTTNPTVFNLFGYNPEVWPNIWHEREFFYSSKIGGRQKTDTEYAEHLQEFIKDRNVTCIYIDPSAASFKLECQRQGIQGLRDADNDVINGIRFVSKLLDNGTFKIVRCCKEAIKEYQTYRWDEKASLRGEDKPIKDFDHSCFVAGTKIITEHGHIPIESVQIGTKVLTRSGWHPVVDTFKNESEVCEFDIFGKKITCTPSHKFMTYKGWKEARDLIQSDMLYINMDNTSWSKQSNLRAESTDDIQTLNTSILEIISRLEDPILSKDLDTFTERFGSRQMDQFQKDTIFITKTTIPSIIALAISNVSQLANIFPCMLPVLQKTKGLLEKIDAMESGILQRNGTQAKRVDLGIESMPRMELAHALSKSLGVISAEMNTPQQNQQTTNFVRISVNLHGEEQLVLIMNRENAWFAEANSKQTSIRENKAALPLVQQSKDGLTDVYNLHVEDEHEYFANGVLVSNCDATRYALYTHFSKKLTANFTKDELDQIYAKANGATLDLPRFFQDPMDLPANNYQQPVW